MAPLPPESTIRYYLDYEGPMGKRTVQFRTNGAASDAAVAAAIGAWLNPMLSIIHNSVVFNSLRRSGVGSNVSNPVPWTNIVGSNSAIMNATQFPRYISFIGRSPDGRKTKLSLYGTTTAVTDDYRLNFSESSAVEAAVNFLNSSSSPFLTISLGVPVWKGYANQGYNAYHQRKRRAVA